MKPKLHSVKAKFLREEYWIAFSCRDADLSVFLPIGSISFDKHFLSYHITSAFPGLTLPHKIPENEFVPFQPLYPHAQL